MMTSPPLYIFGCGGHGRSAAGLARTLGYTSITFIDEAAGKDETLLGHPVLATLPKDHAPMAHGFAAAGDVHQRSHLIEQIRTYNLSLVSLIAPSATLLVGATVGDGVFIGHHSYIGSNAHIDEGAIVNTGAIVEHDCRVGSLSHIAVGAVVAGYTSVGRHCTVGAGAVIVDRLEIGDDIVIGAGATVTKSLKAAGTYIGTPARRHYSG